jgi:hypothetical protein
MPMGSIASAFKKAGLTPRLTGLRVFLHQYRKDGGTLEELLREARIEFELPDEGHNEHAAKSGHIDFAAVRQTNGDDKALHRVPERAIAFAPTSSPPLRGGRGHSTAAEKGRMPIAPPAREPSMIDIRARLESKPTKPAKLFDCERHILFDGQRLMETRKGLFTAYADRCGQQVGKNAVDAEIMAHFAEKHMHQLDDLTLGQLEQNFAEVDAFIAKVKRKHGVRA